MNPQHPTTPGGTAQAAPAAHYKSTHPPAAGLTVAKALEHQQAALAAELHDVIGSELAALSLMLGPLGQLAATDPARHAAALQAAQAQVQRTAAAARSLVNALAPLQGSLPEALESLAEGWTQRGMACRLVLHDGPREEGRGRRPHDLAAAQATQVFRIAQEALTNAARHGAGAPVEITLGRDEDSGNDGWRLQIDQAMMPAAGRRAAVPGSGHGLRFMRARAEALHGELEAGPVADGALWRVCLRWRP